LDRKNKNLADRWEELASRHFAPVVMT
jgi:hypothetical protein